MFVVANKTLKTEIPAMGGAKAENLRYQAISSERIKWGSKKFNELDNPVYGQALDFIGRIIRLPGRSLQSGDDFGKQVYKEENYIDKLFLHDKML